MQIIQEIGDSLNQLDVNLINPVCAELWIQVIPTIGCRPGLGLAFVPSRDSSQVLS